jgi:hypothetical protein
MHTMSEIFASVMLMVVLLVLLSGGVWVGLTLAGVAWFGMAFFTARAAGDAMAISIWGASSSWTLTALPLFVWMGEILYRTNLSESMFRGLAPWVNALPGRLLHTNVIGCTIFASVSGSSAATCATVGKMNVPELRKRGYTEAQIIGSLGGPATLGLLIPPSIILIVYGVSAELSISKLFMAGVLPGLMLAVLFSGWIMVWALLNPDKVPKSDKQLSFMEKIHEAPPDPGGAAHRQRDRQHLQRHCDGHRGCGHRRGWCAGAVGLARGADLGQLQGVAVWRHPAVLHDRPDPGRRGVHDPRHGLHRPATPAGRVCGQPEPLARHADHCAGAVLHRDRLLPGRHLDHRAHHERGAAHHPGRRH